MFYTRFKILLLVDLTLNFQFRVCSFKALKEKISRFTSNEENLKTLTEAEATIGKICLTDFKAKDDFRRVKILETKQIEDQTVVDLFLLDFGVTEFDVPLSDVYEISKQLIEALPFQVSYVFSCSVS